VQWHKHNNWKIYPDPVSRESLREYHMLIINMLANEIMQIRLPSMVAETGLMPVYVGVINDPDDRNHTFPYRLQTFMLSFTGNFSGKPAKALETLMIKRLKEKWQLYNTMNVSGVRKDTNRSVPPILVPPKYLLHYILERPQISVYTYGTPAVFNTNAANQSITACMWRCIASFMSTI